ncbi:RnfABCDGE type electron transport complex subunit G [Desulfofustis glycolicus]|uniref:Ion-translocating oxidoreductase complex subunit G n=1 Tax=Desulfofustis glycolicus DSM 9705 TaxID=1121409 RepID=A0A1M5XXL5_9BACT|nr:RnfABCDGE type electron transport complex subunit G [Desulfofustis glycolicus]MCB2215465.1 RnfABCDGE type electron transport complex subunit G [Desulfobulbaceae bacterium]SHI04555.1 electron transport complex protein RnfG [Desulfofustis glycolicus DSM 9705]
MNELVRMTVVLTGLATIAGGVLAAVHSGTADRIAAQQLEYVKGPAIRSIMAATTNNPLEDSFQLSIGEEEKTVFIGSLASGGTAVAFEEFGRGFGGDIGVMVGINMETETILGTAVTVHSETPGLGAKAKNDRSFTSQFEGLPVSATVAVTQDGGQIDAISGATTTSRAVCEAIAQALERYQMLHADLQKTVN